MVWANEYELYMAGPPVALQRVMSAVLGRFAPSTGLSAVRSSLQGRGCSTRRGEVESAVAARRGGTGSDEELCCRPPTRQQ